MSAPPIGSRSTPAAASSLWPTDDPVNWDTDEARAAKRAIIAHLGEDLFYDSLRQGEDHPYWSRRSVPITAILTRPPAPFARPSSISSAILLPPPENPPEPLKGRDIHLDLVAGAEASSARFPS